MVEIIYPCTSPLTDQLLRAAHAGWNGRLWNEWTETALCAAQRVAFNRTVERGFIFPRQFRENVHLHFIGHNVLSI